METARCLPYQTDYLFLIVGSNPLPNFVAALLLARPRSIIYLLHSGGVHGTGEIAAQLGHAIKKRRPQVDVVPREIRESDSNRIFLQMRRILGDIDTKASVGLHYTGGTKAMAVHVYRAVEKAFPSAVFSYLDSRTLSLIIDGVQGTPTKTMPVGQACEIELGELFALHGYVPQQGIRREPSHPDLCLALAKVCSHADSFKQWRDWHRGDNLQALPTASQYPLLEPVVRAFENLCGGVATAEMVANRLGKEDLVSCTKWFKGEWLEEYTLKAIEQVGCDCGLHDYGIDLQLVRPGRHKVQIDVAAMKGYQLFALSCIASDRKEKCKEHLFEGYVRARQIGGDEARIGLVCCYGDPAALRQEVEETWFTEGRVEVFGMHDLLQLPGRLRDWFDTANVGLS